MGDRKYRRIALSNDPSPDSWEWERARRGYMAIMRRARYWAGMKSIDIKKINGGRHG